MYLVVLLIRLCVCRGNYYGVSEFIFCEMVVNDITLLVGVVYLPHGDILAMEEHISDIVVRYTNVVIMGDFNNNLFHLGKSTIVRNVCNSLNLSLTHNSRPTHYDVSHGSTSLLDYFLFFMSCFFEIVQSVCLSGNIRSRVHIFIA